MSDKDQEFEGEEIVGDISSDLSIEEYEKTDAGITMVEGNYPCSLGALSYYKDSLMLPFTIDEGGYKGKTGALYGSKKPVATKQKRGGKEVDGMFWPLVNWMAAIGIKADDSSGTPVFTKEQVASVKGSRALVVYKNKKYEIYDEVTSETRSGFTPKADKLLPLPDKKTEEVAL